MIDVDDYRQAALNMLREAIGADNVDDDATPIEVEDAQGGAWVLTAVFVSDEQALAASATEAQHD
jgi:hypothetical protein